MASSEDLECSGKRVWGSVGELEMDDEQPDDVETYTCCLMASLRSAEVAPPAAADGLPVSELRSIVDDQCIVSASW